MLLFIWGCKTNNPLKQLTECLFAEKKKTTKQTGNPLPAPSTSKQNRTNSKNFNYSTETHNSPSSIVRKVHPSNPRTYAPPRTHTRYSVSVYWGDDFIIPVARFTVALFSSIPPLPPSTAEAADPRDPVASTSLGGFVFSNVVSLRSILTLFRARHV